MTQLLRILPATRMMVGWLDRPKQQSTGPGLRIPTSFKEAQRPLMKECTLNDTGIPKLIEDVFLS